MRQPPAIKSPQCMRGPWVCAKTLPKRAHRDAVFSKDGKRGEGCFALTMISAGVLPTRPLSVTARTIST